MDRIDVVPVGLQPPAVFVVLAPDGEFHAETAAADFQLQKAGGLAGRLEILVAVGRRRTEEKIGVLGRDINPLRGAMALGRENDGLGGIGVEGARQVLPQSVLPDHQIIVLAYILAVGLFGGTDGERDRAVHHPVTRTHLEPGESIVAECGAAACLHIRRHIEHRQPQVDGLVVLLGHQHGIPIHLLVLTLAAGLSAFRRLGILLVVNMRELAQRAVVDERHDAGLAVGGHARELLQALPQQFQFSALRHGDGGDDDGSLESDSQHIFANL